MEEADHKRTPGLVTPLLIHVFHRSARHRIRAVCKWGWLLVVVLSLLHSERLECLLCASMQLRLADAVCMVSPLPTCLDLR